MMNQFEITDLVNDTLRKNQEKATNMYFGSAEEWKVVIKNSKKRWLGMCVFRTKEIQINQQMIDHCDREMITDTILHECAHALAGMEYSKNGRRMGHGRLWKSWARYLGATPSAKARVPMPGSYVEAKGYAYKIVTVDGDNIESVGHAKRKLKNMETRYIRGNKAKTMGKLWMVKTDDWNAHASNPAALKTKLIR